MSDANAINVAVPELRRYAPDLLRVVGVPIGLADEVADTLVWTEAARGGAVRFLQENRARLYWTPRPRMRVLSEDGPESVIDARGGSLLEFGTRVLEYVEARVSSEGKATVHVRTVFGSIFIPYLRHLAESRGVLLSAQVGKLVDGSHTIIFEAVRRGDGLSPDFSEIDALRSEHQRSVEQGLKMSPADFRTVTELFEMLRVPTSEHSRTHAG